MQKVLFTILVLINVLFFQNCVGKKFDSAEGEATKSKGTETDSTGQPYDGKIYIVAGALCGDGTFVQSRIVVNTVTSAKVVRENCKDASRNLGPGEFTFNLNNPDQIIYGQQTFSKEAAWVQIPILSSWFNQLTGPIQTTSALVYDIDLFDTSAAQIQSLKQSGHIVICSLSSGTSENWRPDASSFVANDLGNNVSGSSGEKWVDTRSTTVRSLMVNRLELAKTKGCDGVDLDSADGYSNNSGFPLTSASQIDYNQYLAFAAHDRHLIVAMKNTADLAAKLVDSYDFAIAGECFRYNECSKYQPFTAQGKAILGAEFTSFSNAQCTTARSSSISLAFFNQALDGSSYQPCP
jgi:hypothetical protein